MLALITKASEDFWYQFKEINTISEKLLKIFGISLKKLIQFLIYLMFILLLSLVRMHMLIGLKICFQSFGTEYRKKIFLILKRRDAMLLFMTLGQNRSIDKLRRRLKSLLLFLLKPLDKKPGRGEACHYTIPRTIYQAKMAGKLHKVFPIILCNLSIVISVSYVIIHNVRRGKNKKVVA